MPALAGALAVPLTAGLRPLMGRAAALCAAALIALSPLWVFTGRSVAVDAIAIAVALALLASNAPPTSYSRWMMPFSLPLFTMPERRGCYNLL